MADVVFTCNRCGAKGDPPACDHFAHPWSQEQIASAHRAIELPKRSPEQLANDLRVRSGHLSSEQWEAPVTKAMMREAADLLVAIEADRETLEKQLAHTLHEFDAAVTLVRSLKAELQSAITRIEALHQERDEIKAELGLMAGGVGLSLATEVRSLKQRAEMSDGSIKDLQAGLRAEQHLIEEGFKAGYHCQWIADEGRYIFDPAMKPGDADGAFAAWLMLRRP